MTMLSLKACRENRSGCKRREAARSAPKGYEAQARKKYGPVKKKK